MSNASMSDIFMSNTSMSKNSMSNIDMAVNKILNTESEIVSMLSKRFIFPHQDLDIYQHQDQRSPSDKFNDIINILNTKLSPEMKALWSKICNYNIENPCYYKTGMSFMQQEMNKVRETYKYNKPVKIDASQTIPENLLTKPHSTHCKTTDNVCTYSSQVNKIKFSKAKNLFDFLIDNQSEINTVLNQKENANLLITHLLNKNERFCTNFLKTCLSLVKRNLTLCVKKIAKLF